MMIPILSGRNAIFLNLFLDGATSWSDLVASLHWGVPPVAIFYRSPVGSIRSHVCPPAGDPCGGRAPRRSGADLQVGNPGRDQGMAGERELM